MDVGAALERLRDFETVIDTMYCGLVAEERDGTVVFINQRMLDWLGYERDEVLGKHVSMLVPEELRALIEQDIEASEAGDLRARLMAVRRKDSTTFPVVTLPQRFLDPEGRPDGYFSIVIDMGAVMTAKSIGETHALDVRSALARIAMELQSISLSTELGGSTALPLQHPDLAELSPRELEVLTLLMSGERVPTIAEHLHISPHTVRNHLKSMYRKLGVGKQSELIERIRSLGQADMACAPGHTR